MKKSAMKIFGFMAVLALAASPAVAAMPPFPGVASLSLSSATTAQQATVEGTWSTRTRENDDGDRWVQISMEMDFSKMFFDSHGDCGYGSLQRFVNNARSYCVKRFFVEGSFDENDNNTRLSAAKDTMIWFTSRSLAQNSTVKRRM